MKTHPLHFFLLSGALGVLLGGCTLFGKPSPAAAPALNTTQVYQTVQVRLTEALALTQAQPATATVPPADTLPPPAASETPAPPPTATLPAATASPTAQCNQAAPGSPIDITIPDDTEMSPGQTFVKTWRLVNTGTCPWTSEYAAVWFSGEQMGAPASIPLPGRVAPGESVDISVEMTAPQEPGAYQSNWKLRSPSGVLFGLGPGDGLFYYVRIKVVLTDTPTPTLLPTKTPQPTAAPRASGPATLTLSDTLDLDANLINPAAGADLFYGRDSEGRPALQPRNGALMGVFGGLPPLISDCQRAALSTAALRVDDLMLGAYLCYRTDSGRPGWLRITGYISDTQTLNTALFTWDTQ